MSTRTGNIAVEIKCVENTAANIWFYKIGDEFRYTNLNYLKREIGTNGVFVHGGDGGRSYMKLIPMTRFNNNSKKFEPPCL